MREKYYDFIVAAGKPINSLFDDGSESYENGALYTCRLDADGDDMRVVNRSALSETSPPGYFKVVQSRSGVSLLYALSGEEISWYSIGNDGGLKFQGSILTGSQSATHLCTDTSANLLFTANYGDGTVSLFTIADDGALGEAKVYSNGEGAHHGARGEWGDGPQFRQESAHPHGVVVCGDQLYVADLGSNQVVCWSIDFENSVLQSASNVTLHDLAGPRHIEFLGNGEVGYVLNELDNTVCVLRRDASDGGKLSIIQTLSSLPDGWIEKNTDPTTFPNEVYSKPSHASELLLSPDNKFLYASNRGHDSIAVFGINSSDGILNTLHFEPTLGRIPWVFCISEDGRFLVVQNNHTRTREGGSDSVVVFLRDTVTGLLKETKIRLEFSMVSAVWTLPTNPC